jgi:hypothetical protein
MRFALTLCLVVLVVPAVGTKCHESFIAPRIGTNLEELTTYTTGIPHCNRIRELSNWSAILGATGATFHAGTGWPTGWAPNGIGELAAYFNRELLRVHAPGGTHPASPAHFPAGSYTVTWDGDATTGDFVIDGSATGFTVTGAGTGTFRVVTPQQQGLRLRLKDPAHIPGNLEVTADGEPCTGQWRKGFVDSLQGFAAIRFMDWMRTSWSPTGIWANRTKPTWYSFGTNTAPNGVALEQMIDLSNTVGSDSWFTLPDTATNEYMANFAEISCTALDEDLDLYVELANEPWNFHHPWVAARNRMDAAGNADFDPATPGVQTLPEPQWFYYQVRRTMEMAAIFEAECGDARVTSVLNVQNADPSKSALTIMNWDPPGLGSLRVRDVVEAIAVAPYFNVGKDSAGGLHTLDSGNAAFAGIANTDCVSAGQGPGGPTACCTGARTGTCPGTNVRDWPPSRWHEAYRENMAPVLTLTAQHCANAAAVGLRCIAYEWGVHSVLYGTGAENDAVLVGSHWAAQDDPGMERVMLDFLAMMKLAGLDLVAHYVHQGRALRSAYFPACEWYDSCQSHPKYRALRRTIDRHTE